MKKAVVITMVLAALALPVYAAKNEDSVWGSVMVRAYHSDRTKDYNENTLGVGLEYTPSGWKRWRLIAGGYDNSFYKPSYYAGAAYLPWKIGGLQAGVMLGMISGYKQYNGNFGPIATGLLTYEKDGYGANLLIVPKVTAESGYTFALQIKKQFK